MIAAIKGHMQFQRKTMLFYKLSLQRFYALNCANCRIMVLQDSNKKSNCTRQDALKSYRIPDSETLTTYSSSKSNAFIHINDPSF